MPPFEANTVESGSYLTYVPAMRTVTYDLRALLRLARDGGYTIPVFQREFVWKEAQVKLLVDSVSRNFPIGSLLVLAESSPSMPTLAARPIDATIAALDKDEEPGLPAPDAVESARQDRYYVLDGQQRLTSLVRVFLDAGTDKSYYVDLKRLFDQFVPNGGQQWRRDPSEMPWVRALKRKQPNPERRERNRYLRSDAVLESEKCLIFVQEYFEDTGDFGDRLADKTERRKAAAAVNKVFETIRNYHVPVVVIDRDSPLEAICRVFETINSTGTRLTTFDLAVARFYPQPDLRTLWNEECNQYDVLKRFAVDGERVLQVLALWRATDSGQYLEPTRTAILGLERDFIQKRWSDAAKHLAEAYEWAEAHGASPKYAPNDSTLVTLAAFFGRADGAWRQQTVGFSTVLEKWYFSKLLQSGSRQATNYNVGRDFRDLWTWHEDGKVPPCPTVNLDEQALIDIRPSDVRYRTLHALLAINARFDVRTGQPLRPQEVEDHHIFPISFARSEKLLRRHLDSICNRLLISADTNRHLSDRPPEEYMGEIAIEARKNGIEARVDERLRAAALPGSIRERDFATRFKISAFDQFLRDRAAKILGHVREAIGDSLTAVTKSSVAGSDGAADLLDTDDDD
jgi:hypothetical protein